MMTEVESTSTSRIASAVPTESNDDRGYIQTATHNYISRQATVLGAKQVEIKGRTVVEPNAKICGNDSTWIRIGRYCRIQQGTTIEIPLLGSIVQKANNKAASVTDTRYGDGSSQQHQAKTPNDNVQMYVPVQIGSHTLIGQNCIIQAAAIGSYCWIGNNVQIGPRCIIRDCCIIESNTKIPSDTVVPPFTRVTMMNGKPNTTTTTAVHTNSNNNGKMFRRLIRTELPPATSIRLQEQSMEFFQEFSAQQRKIQLSKK